MLPWLPLRPPWKRLLLRRLRKHLQWRLRLSRLLRLPKLRLLNQHRQRLLLRLPRRLWRQRPRIALPATPTRFRLPLDNPPAASSCRRPVLVRCTRLRLWWLRRRWRLPAIRLLAAFSVAGPSLIVVPVVPRAVLAAIRPGPVALLDSIPPVSSPAVPDPSIRPAPLRAAMLAPAVLPAVPARVPALAHGPASVARLVLVLVALPVRVALEAQRLRARLRVRSALPQRAVVVVSSIPRPRKVR